MDDTEAASFRSDNAIFSRFSDHFISLTDKLIRDAIYTMQATNPTDISTESLLDVVQESLLSEIEDDDDSKSLLYSHFEQYVKNRLQSCVDRELEFDGDVSDEDHFVPLSSNNIMKTMEYETLLNDICLKLEQTTDELSGVSCPRNVPDFRKLGFNRESASPTNDSDSSSLTSYGGGTYWEMLSPERLRELSEALDSRNPKQTREVALKTLYSLPVADIVEFDSWPLLRQLVTDALVGPDESTFKLALSLHIKMLHSTSSTCMIEGYASLVKALSSVLERLMKWCLPSVDPQDTNFERALQIGGLINAYQRTVPRYWTRFLENHSKVLAKETVGLMMVRKWKQDPFQLIPFHIMALVDFKAIWFARWTRGHNGRALLYEQLKVNSNVLPTLVTECVGYYDCFNCPDVDGQKEACNIPSHPSYIRYCCAMYSASILGYILGTSQGTDLIDSQLQMAEMQMTGTDFLVHGLQTALAFCKTVHECNAFCAAKVLCDSIVGVIQQDSSCYRHTLDGRIYSTILQLLHYWSSGPQDEVYDIAPVDLHALNHATDILLHLIESTIDRNIILTTSESLTTIAMFSKKILLVSERGLTKPHDTVLETVKAAVVRICCYIMATHDGVCSMVKSGILQGIAEDWVSGLQDDKNTTVLNGSSHKLERDKLLDWLLEFSRVGCTPKGLAALYDVELLQDVLVGIEKELIRNSEVWVNLGVKISVGWIFFVLKCIFIRWLLTKG